MSVQLTGKERGKMTFELDRHLTREDRKALEATIRKRARVTYFDCGSRAMILRIDVGELSRDAGIKVLEKIHSSIKGEIAHKTVKAKTRAFA